MERDVVTIAVITPGCGPCPSIGKPETRPSTGTEDGRLFFPSNLLSVSRRVLLIAHSFCCFHDTRVWNLTTNSCILRRRRRRCRAAFSPLSFSFRSFSDFTRRKKNCVPLPLSDLGPSKALKSPNFANTKRFFRPARKSALAPPESDSRAK